ncbi:acyl-CoA desaturase [Pseudonocardia sp. ICBG601]|uniref:acyl-CoA desaturase n=1 Tax=Pseudonocardia sp. ICBG601 TaxID=2846759 RepID=UPI0027E3638D|nr:acyl-CoA desaturase [Pseudonocardia sp. ICBG601]
MTIEDASGRASTGRAPLFDGRRRRREVLLVGVFVILPTLALFTAVPLAWGWGLGWVDVVLFVVFYGISGLGVTVGFHRYFTHGSFKAKRPLRIALAIAGSLSLQGGVLEWVGTHRRHHAFSDKEGDPHSPWLYGTGAKALVKGFWHSHLGWNFKRDLTNHQRFAPDLIADSTMRLIQAPSGKCVEDESDDCRDRRFKCGVGSTVVCVENFPRLDMGDDSLDGGACAVEALVECFLPVEKFPEAYS